MKFERQKPMPFKFEYADGADLRLNYPELRHLIARQLELPKKIGEWQGERDIITNDPLIQGLCWTHKVYGGYVWAFVVTTQKAKDYSKKISDKEGYFAFAFKRSRNANEWETDKISFRISFVSAKDVAYKMYCKKAKIEFKSLKPKRHISEERRKQLKELGRNMGAKRWHQKVQCPVCDCDIELKGNYDNAEFVECPDCGSVIQVTPSMLKR